MSSRCHYFSSWTLILAALVLHSNKLIVDASDCFYAKAIADSIMQVLNCRLPYTCPVCLPNYDGAGTELATCTNKEGYCLNGVCAIFSVSGAWAPNGPVKLTLFQMEFYLGLTGIIRWIKTESPLTGTTCSFELSGKKCSSCSYVKCPGTDVFKMQADCSNLGQGSLDTCAEDPVTNAGDFLRYWVLPETAECNGGGTEPPTNGGVQPPASSGGGSCFSATSTVQVLGQGSVQMQDLKLEDQVLTGSPGNFKYQPVYAFGHLDKAALGTFYAIATKGSRKPLEMTGEHLVYLAEKHNPVRAASLMVGDTLLSTHGPTEITSIRIVKKQGLFNPLTADGHLIVDDIAVSTYIALQENDQEHFQVVVDKERDIKFNLISHQNFVHLYLAPFRMLCMGISSQLCQVHNAEGIPLYISYGMTLVNSVGEQNVLVQLLFLLVTFPILLLFLAMEKMAGSSVAPLAIFSIALLAKEAPMYLFLKKTKVV